MVEATFQEKDEEARIRVEMARGYFRDNSIQVAVTDETAQNILLGMKFQPTNINYVTNTVTFKLVE